MKSALVISAQLLIAVIAYFILHVSYIDGDYSAKSSAHYTREPYVGEVEIKIKNGRIMDVTFSITDTAKKVLFDSTYQKYFKGNELYMQQCRSDWEGVKIYPSKLTESQDIEKVDAISGATWSYNIFKASVKEALVKAEKQNSEGFLVK